MAKKIKIKLNANISRRDFISGTLVGVGAVLLYSYIDVINTVSKDPCVVFFATASFNMMSW